MKTIKLNLSEDEKLQLRKNGLKISRLNEFAADEIAVLLNSDIQRAKEIYASVSFQAIPSIGPKFAGDLISMGYYAIEDLIDKNPSALLDDLECEQGFWTDPCV